jgi:hypothetical protein
VAAVVGVVPTHRGVNRVLQEIDAPQDLSVTAGRSISATAPNYFAAF